MRWEDLFADLSGQADEAERLTLEAEVVDRTRRELARVRLYDRLGAAVGARLRLVLLGGAVVDGVLLDVGPDWCLVAEAAGRRALVPLGAVALVAGLGRRSTPPGTEGAVASRRTLAHALRALARDRAEVIAVLLDGSSRVGTPDRVGSDYVELAEHLPGEARRPGAVTGVLAVPFAAIALLRSS